MPMTGDTTLENGAQEAGKRFGDLAAKAQRQVHKIADQVGLGDQADQLVAKVERQASRSYGAMKETVRERPTLAVGVAAGVGVLIGLMLARR